MAELYKFGNSDNSGAAQHPECVACEAMLADAVDEVLSDADRAWFDQHIATCGACSAAFGDAQRGAAWLDLLKSPRPEPSADLMDRILAATSGSAVSLEPGLVAVPAASVAGKVIPFRPRLLQMPEWQRVLGATSRVTARAAFEPRLMMTAAMAFFSIALTMNLTGVRLDELHAIDLRPSSLKHEYYQASASAARRYESFRVVHALESRVDDLRTNIRDTGDGPGERNIVPESRRDRSAGSADGDKRPARKPAESPDLKDSKDSNDSKDSPDPHGVSRSQPPAEKTGVLPGDEML